MKIKAKYCYYMFCAERYYIFKGRLVYDSLGRRFVSAYNVTIKKYIAK